MLIKLTNAIAAVRRQFTRQISLKVVSVIAVLLLLPYLHWWYNSRAIRLAHTDLKNGLEIKDLIRQVKKELYETEVEMRQQREEAMFKVKTFDLELNFMVHANTKTGAELKVVSGETDTSLEKTQKITLHFEAIEHPEKTETAAPSPSVGKPDMVIGPSGSS